MKIKDVGELLQALGGSAKTQRLMKENGFDVGQPSTIGQWKVSNAIPVKWWRAIIVIGAKSGLELSVEKMLMLYERDEIDV